MAPLASRRTGSIASRAEAEQPQRPVDGGVPLLARPPPAPAGHRSGRRRSTSQPAPASTWWRAAASPTVLAACAPVTKPTEADAGRPSRSLSQPPAASSAATPAGPRDGVERVLVPARREHVRRRRGRQRTADTKPKKRGPGERHQPRLGRRDELARAPSPAASAAAGSGPPNASARPVSSTRGRTGRSARPARKVAATSATRANSAARSSIRRPYAAPRRVRVGDQGSAGGDP